MGKAHKKGGRRKLSMPHKRGVHMRRAVLHALDLPEDTVPTVLKLTMVGKHDLLVENYRGVLQYDHALVRLLLYEGVLMVTGEGLELMELSETRAYIRGGISGINLSE